MTVSALARKAEPQPFGQRNAVRTPIGCTLGRVVQNHGVIAATDRRKVAIDDAGLEQVFGLQAIEPVTQPRSSFALNQLFVACAICLSARLQAPLAHEGGALVEVSRVLAKGDAFDNSGSPEGRGWHAVVGRHIAALRQVIGFGQLKQVLSRNDSLLEIWQNDRLVAALDAHERIHESQTFEGVSRISHLT